MMLKPKALFIKIYQTVQTMESSKHYKLCKKSSEIYSSKVLRVINMINNALIFIFERHFIHLFKDNEFNI